MSSPATGFVPLPRFTSRRVVPAPPAAEIDGVPPAAPSALDVGTVEHAAPHADFGPLQSYLDRPGVTDVLVNGPDDLWVDSGQGLQRDGEWHCPDDDHLRSLAVRLIAQGDRHVDESTPCADVRLGGGVRVHVVLPPISRRGTLLSIRVPSTDAPDLDALDALGIFGDDAEAPAVREYVESAVTDRRNLLVSGPTGSGKTTLLAALLARAPAAQRIVALEDVAELRVDHPHFVGLEARQANTEGAGEVSLRRLLREALRMRPDRLVLGECRGAEAFDLFAALNTGHDGGAGTLHANSLADVPARIETLGLLAGLGPEVIARQAASAIDLVIQLERHGARRRIGGIGRLDVGDSGRLAVTAVYGA